MTDFLKRRKGVRYPMACFPFAHCGVSGERLNPIELGGIRPDFILITVYFLGILKGTSEAAHRGLLGFFLDITSAGPVYSNIFSKSFMGYLAGVKGTMGS